MKTRYLFLAALLLAAAGCDDNDNGGGNPGISVWELSHRDYLLLRGNVSETVESLTEEGEEPFVICETKFDAAGRLTLSNTTGMEFDAPAATYASRSTWISPEAVAYRYDPQGRMIRVEVYALGEPDPTTYEISYGTHTRYVPVPFRFADKPLWLLRGVSAITGSDGYSLRCDGTTASAETAETWEGKHVSTVAFEGDYPVRIETTTQQRGETLMTTTTEYTWGAAGRLLRSSEQMTDAASGDKQTTLTEYDPSLLLSPLRTTVTVNGETSYVFTYTYFGNGLPGTGSYTEGQGFLETPFEKNYSGEDAHGNWTRCTTTSMDSPITTDRKISYF